MTLTLVVCLNVGQLPQGFVSTSSGLTGNNLRADVRMVRGQAALNMEPTGSSPSSLHALRLGLLGAAALLYSSSKWGARRAAKKACCRVAVAAVAEMREVAVEQDVFLTRLRQLAAEGNGQEAEDVLYDMIDQGRRPAAAHFRELIQSCVPRADVVRADRWLFRMKALEVEPDIATFNTLMAVSAEAADPPNAEKWLSEAWKSGHQPDSESFRHILHAIRKSKDTVNIEVWFERLMTSGIQPDEACCTEVISLYAEDGNLAKVNEWIAIARKNLGLRLGIDAYNAALAAYAKEAGLEVAEQLFEDLATQDVEPNAQTFAILTGDGRDFRTYDTVAKWSQRLVESGVEIDSESYAAVIGSWAAVGDAQQAEEWYSRMMGDNKQTPEALALVVDALVLAAGDEGAESASEWVRQSEDAGMELTQAVYAALASADVARGDFEQVEAQMQQMEAQGLQMNEDSLVALLLAYSNAEPQQTQLAEQMFKQLMFRGNVAATREVLEALRAAVGGARCLSLRRELKLAKDPKEGQEKDPGIFGAKDFMRPRGERVWPQFKLPEKEVKMKWE